MFVPVTIALIAALISQHQAIRQLEIENERAQQAQKIENQRAEAERELEEQRSQDEALQAYLDQMSSLLLDKDLRTSEEDSDVRSLAKARTLTVLGRLDSGRKRNLLRFLYEAKLIDKESPVVDLTEADFAEANLSGMNLSNANIAGADLTEANLREASLEGADLSNTQLQGADLELAFLKDAVLTGAEFSKLDVVSTQVPSTVGDWPEAGGADLSGAILDGADFGFNNMQGVDMGPPAGAFTAGQHTNLNNVDLVDVSLDGADLRRVELKGANLQGSSFFLADLSGADLHGANLNGTFLDGADLEGIEGITNEQVAQQASSLWGATMPNGQKYEDWLKSKGSGEGRKDAGTS